MKLNQKLARLLRKLAYKLDPIHEFQPSTPIQLDSELYNITTLTCCQTIKANDVEIFSHIAKRDIQRMLADKLSTLCSELIEVKSTPTYEGDILLTAQLRVLKPKGGAE